MWSRDRFATELLPHSAQKLLGDTRNGPPDPLPGAPRGVSENGFGLWLGVFSPFCMVRAVSVRTPSTKKVC